VNIQKATKEILLDCASLQLIPPSRLPLPPIATSTLQPRQPYKAAATPANTKPTAPANPLLKPSAPPVDCSVLPEALAEALALAAEEVELAPDIVLEAMLEAEDMAEEADMEALPAMEDIEEDMSIMEELIMLLMGAAVELAEAEPSQDAAVGRLVTPWPEQSEFANSMVSVKKVLSVWCNINCATDSRILELTHLVILVTSLANTAREVGDETLSAADALHIQGAAVAEAGSDTGCGARGEAWDLGGGEAREQSYGCEGEGGVHVCEYYRV
jgi:hypothetical protein